MKSLAEYAVVLGFALSMSAPVWAAERKKDDAWIIDLQVENDLFGSGLDRHYTNGMRLALMAPEGKTPEKVVDLARMFPLFSETAQPRFAVSLGQSMFTPSDITIPGKQDDERPWAGWTYGSIGLVAPDEDGSRLDNLELILGIVGPQSYAADTQVWWHEVIDSPRPAGWHNQLKNEPGVVLAYERKHRALWEESELVGDFGIDLTPHAGVALGNVFTHVAAGATVRFGDNLPDDYGPPRIRPSLPGSSYFAPDDDFGWYLFAGVEGRAVGRNIFLDGNTFRDSDSVEKKHLVGDLQAGVALRVMGTRLAFTWVWRTREFETQTDPDVFGSVSLAFRL